MSVNFANYRFLVVDDNPHMCRIVKAILAQFGARDIVTVNNVNAALDEMQSRVFDILITDHLMEPFDGLQLTHMIRSAAENINANMPIVMMTAYTEAHRIKAAKDAGISALVAKPFTPMDLYTRIVHALNHHPVIEQPEDDKEEVVLL